MIEPWQELSREEVFSKYGKKIQKVIYRLPNGDEADFYVRDERLASTVLALTPENEVILVRQFRPGPQKIMLDMPGGNVDGNEDALAAAGRELYEETGYEGDVEFVGTCIDDAYSNLIRHFYVATNCRKTGETDNSNPTEQIEVVVVSLKEFREVLRAGELTDVEAGYMGLDHLNLL